MTKFFLELVLKILAYLVKNKNTATDAPKKGELEKKIKDKLREDGFDV